MLYDQKLPGEREDVQGCTSTLVPRRDEGPEALQEQILGQMFPEFSRDWHFQEFPKQWDPWIMSRVRCPEKKSMEGSLKLSLYVAMDVTCRHGRHLRMLALEGSDSLPPTSLKAAGLDEGLSRVYGLGYIGFRV